MIETSDLHYRETIEALNSVEPYHNEHDADSQHDPVRKRWIGQVLRFGLVGGLNTIVDLLILNMLLLLIPTSSTRMILIYSAIAYSLGAVNSFLLNKYWTFGYRQRTTWREVVRFIVTTLCGIGWSSIILWLASNALHSILINPTIWANASKVIAISGTALISYLGMSLWVFVSKARKEHTQFNAAVPVRDDAGTYPSCQHCCAVLARSTNAASAGTYPSCQRCCAATLRVRQDARSATATQSSRTKGSYPTGHLNVRK